MRAPTFLRSDYLCFVDTGSRRRTPGPPPFSRCHMRRRRPSCGSGGTALIRAIATRTSPSGPGVSFEGDGTSARIDDCVDFRCAPAPLSGRSHALRPPALSARCPFLAGAAEYQDRHQGEPINWIPASHQRQPLFQSQRLRSGPGGSPSTASRRFMVRALTPDLSANSSIDQSMRLFLHVICAPTIIDKALIVSYKMTIQVVL